MQGTRVASIAGLVVVGVVALAGAGFAGNVILGNVERSYATARAQMLDDAAAMLSSSSVSSSVSSSDSSSVPSSSDSSSVPSSSSDSTSASAVAVADGDRREIEIPVGDGMQKVVVQVVSTRDAADEGQSGDVASARSDAESKRVDVSVSSSAPAGEVVSDVGGADAGSAASSKPSADSLREVTSAHPSQAALDSAGATCPRNDVYLDTYGGWVYFVKPGDTLSSISAKFAVTVDELGRYNHIDNYDLIYDDSVLRIPPC